MAFPPGFLDELRSRIPLGDLVARRVRLTRRGREQAGLCPFHNEKTPSFYVVEDKGFFHCFGCGAHGDAIGYVMRADSLDFIEAVERLAGEAGIAVPQQTPQDRERAQRQKTLLEALAAAADFYEAQLWAPSGARARDYLTARGLDEETIRRFRLGWAGEDRQALRRALAVGLQPTGLSRGDFPETLLREAGLLRTPEDGGNPYDYFHGRVMFPIGDRAGRVIAFGARTLGDDQPKYLNSPDTPVFEKGRVLYAWAAARAALARAPEGASAIIVVEGYMDVIALHRAGFATAVAPLGTALTEMQLAELWRLSPEPVLCFDGDMAGQRAALRALFRALPILQPGRSLRFATLPPGEDPDSLIHNRGRLVFDEILSGARPLSEMLWQAELDARPVDTPERRADLERRVMARAGLIADRAVQNEYRRFLRDRLFAQSRQAWGRPGRPGRPGLRRAAVPAPGLGHDGPPPPLPRSPGRSRREILLRMLLHHPVLIGEASEEITALDFPEPELENLRREILQAEVVHPGLDAPALRQHLEQCGLATTVDRIFSPSVDHAGFLSHNADDQAVRLALLHVLKMIRDDEPSESANAAEALARDPSPANWERFLTLRGRETEDDLAADALLSGDLGEQELP